MNQLFNRWLPAATFLAWGGVTYYLSHRDGYLQAPFTTYAQIAGVVLLLIGVVLAATKPEANCCADSACSHGLSRSIWGRLSTFAVVGLPIALLFFADAEKLRAVQLANKKELEYIDKDALKARMDGRRKGPGKPAAAAGLVTPGDTAAAPRQRVTPLDNPQLPGPVQPPPALPLPSKDGNAETAENKAVTQPPAPTTPPASPGTPPPMPQPVAQNPTDWLLRTPDGLIIAEVIDLLYAAQDNTLRADFEGKKVQLIGQFMPDHGGQPTSPGMKRFKAVRMWMTCCAADARPVASLVETELPLDFPEMQWVKIVGTPTFPVEKGRRISVLKAERIEKTEPVQEEFPATDEQ
jgi:hypothetical protein